MQAPLPKSSGALLPNRRDFIRSGATLAAATMTGLIVRLPPPAAAGRLSPALAELHERVARGDVSAVRALLTKHPALARTVDKSGRSLFLLAHLHDHADVADVIKRHLGDLDLVESIADGDYERVKRLAAAARRTINDPHPVGGTAYFAAARLGRVREMWPLNRNGGDPNARPLGPATMTPVRAAFECPDPARAADAALRMLTDAGEPTLPQPNGDTILHAAARLGDLDVLRTILRKGGDPEARNASGDTPIEVARAVGHDAAVALLENADSVARIVTTSRFATAIGGEPYSRPEVDVPQSVIDEFGEVSHFDLDRVKTLVAEYPHVVHGNASWNELGVEAGAHMGRRDMTDFLLEKGAPISLPTTLMIRDATLARRLLEADPTRIRERGPHDFALMWYPGIGGASIEMAELLIEFGADVDEEKFGATALHHAARNGHVDLADFLIHHGADVNAVGRADFTDLVGTPMTWAESQGRSEVVSLLAARGGRR